MAAAAAGSVAPRPPSTGVDDFVPDSIQLVRTVSAVQSAELAERGCLLATALEEHFLRVVRAVGTMDILLNRILSYFAVCLVTAGFFFTYVCEDGSFEPFVYKCDLFTKTGSGQT